jgi:UDP-N-acetylmuramyl pentapeptide phosphotransferase/UDP-N-acetylglucosamine-1-phosphate transferase
MALDHPVDRSLHRVPTPRSCGIGIPLSFLAGAIAARVSGRLPDPLAFLALAALLVSAVGFLDDRRHIPAWMRLLAQTAAAALAVAGGCRLDSIGLPFLGTVATGVLAWPVSILFLVGVTNFYNFMDGIDGLAGGQAVFFCAFLLALTRARGSDALLVAATGGGALGFLAWNFPPARCFMGDVGSYFLGFLFAGLSLFHNGEGSVPILVPVILLLSFLFDAGWTLGRRLLRGENVFRAHREHFYQFYASRHGHRAVTLVEYVVFAALGALALLYARMPDWARVLSVAGPPALFLAAHAGGRRATSSDRT